jgi:hypothetical protein
MKPLVLACSIFALALFAGCSSSTRDEQRTPPPAPAPARLDTLSDLSAAVPDQPDDDTPEQELLESAQPWSPRFVQTGLASGIMVEFTGIKKGKTLQAKFANIELHRYLADTTAPPPAGTMPQVSGLMRTQATINNLHQAFFKVQPGKYFFRLTNPWADRRMIRDLEVREGAYSVLSNDVYAAWLRRTRQPADTSSVKE